MLFPYTYVPHQMEKMQAFIDFIFFEVWCQAPVSKSYSLDLFDANPELHEVMTAFHYDDSKGAEFFSGHVERIHGLFVALSDTQIDLFRQWYRANNDIEKVCANDPGISVIRYSDLPDELEDVRDQLKSFFKGLYSHLDLAALKGKIGELDDHYDNAFWSANKKGKCPFCGIADIKGTHHTKREAYDHYLPKALYPFNSINFRNLVPACHGCNSAYKGSKDPAHNAAEQRRKAFYPYAAAVHGIEVKVALRHSDVDNLAPEDITLQFGPPALNEEIATWKDVYGIEERYRGKLLDGDGKAWLQEILDEWRWKDEPAGGGGKSPDEYLRDLARHAKRSPYTSDNFLKNGFLQACKDAGLFEQQVHPNIAP